MNTEKKILVDGISLLSPFTGVAKYTYENASRMRERYGEYAWFYDYGFHSRELVKADTGKQSVNLLKKIKSFIVSKPWIKTAGRETLSLLSYLSSPTYDLYWQPNYIPRKVKSRKTVTTVHDFSFHIQPEWHPAERLNYYRKQFWKRAAASDWIITGSHFTKQEIVAYMGYPEEKISVIYHAADHNLYRVYERSVLQKTKETFNLPEHFLLFVGSIEPRKNLIGLLKAYHHLPAETKKHCPLILVGFKGWENRAIMQEIEKEKAYIRYLGYVSDEALAHIYNLATLFIYPTLYEGFGIPPLEAMACGTPVIASKVASVPESCGDAAAYIDPKDPHALAAVIMDLLSHEEKQEALTAKGLVHTRRFTWDKAAKAHMDVFRKVMAQ